MIISKEVDGFLIEYSNNQDEIISIKFGQQKFTRGQKVKSSGLSKITAFHIPKDTCGLIVELSLLTYATDPIDRIEIRVWFEGHICAHWLKPKDLVTEEEKK